MQRLWFEKAKIIYLEKILRKHVRIEVILDFILGSAVLHVAVKELFSHSECKV